jgi:hypothetical protein
MLPTFWPQPSLQVLIVLVRQNEGKCSYSNSAELLRTGSKHGGMWFLHQDMQGVFLSAVRNGHHGDYGIQRRDFVGDEQHVEAHSAGDNDPECSGKFRKEDAGVELLYFDQVAYDEGTVIMII